MVTLERGFPVYVLRKILDYSRVTLSFFIIFIFIIFIFFIINQYNKYNNTMSAINKEIKSYGAYNIVT